MNALDLLAASSALLAARLQASVVAVRAQGGGGSGTIWSADGLIVTNSHVVTGDSAEVMTWDERALPARLVARDPTHDLAALKVETSGLPAVAVGDSTAVRVGQLAVAVGNPGGVRGYVTAGVVFSIGGAAVENQAPLPEVIRADVRLAPGNSGGPLADAHGRVIGINAMIAGGMAVAVPSNTVARFVEAEVGEGGRGFLGIVAQPVALPPSLARAAGMRDGAGLMLTSVEPGSPAARAGLMPGDLLVGLGPDTGSVPAVAGGLRRMRAGRPVHLAVVRGGERYTVEAVPV